MERERLLGRSRLQAEVGTQFLSPFATFQLSFFRPFLNTPTMGAGTAWTRHLGLRLGRSARPPSPHPGKGDIPGPDVGPPKAPLNALPSFLLWVNAERRKSFGGVGEGSWVKGLHLST